MVGGIEATFGNPKVSGVQPFSSMFLSLLLPGCVRGMTTLSFTSGCESSERYNC